MSRGKKLLLILLMLVGVGILAYPGISNGINRLHGSYAIEEFEIRVENADIALERRKAEKYNQDIRNSIPADGFSGEADKVETVYYDTLDFGGGMMGYLRIPKIDVNLPIYHGTDEEILAKGVGHLSQSALPIGGEGNHSVLTGHTGLPSAKLFNDLTELKEGDLFHIGILGEMLTYQVDRIKVVLPSEGQDLTSVSGEDYCTLVTCTPYGINTHRLLVRGHRIETLGTEPDTAGNRMVKQNNGYLWLIGVSLTLLLLVFLIILKIDISSYA